MACAAALLLVGCFFNVSQVVADDAIELTWLISPLESEPFQVVIPDDPAGPRGIIADILHEALASTPLTLKLIERPFKRIRRELLEGLHDNWISYGSPVWQYQPLLEIGEYVQVPLLTSDYWLVSRTQDARDPHDDKAFFRRKVIVINGFDYHPDFHRWVNEQQITLIAAPSPRHALAMLEKKRGDFFLVENWRYLWHVKRYTDNPSAFAGVDVSHIHPSATLFLLVDRRLPAAVRQLLYEQLAAMRRQGRLDAILEAYR